MAVQLTGELVQEMAREAIATADATPPEAVTPAKELVSLQRKWRLVYGPRSIPEDLETLRAVVPSGLTEAERTNFLLGSLNEARKAYIGTLNTSWTKAELRRKLDEAGLAHALESFDSGTQESLREVIKYLTDA